MCMINIQDTDLLDAAEISIGTPKGWPAPLANQIAWDQMNAAWISLIPAQTPVRTIMDHNQMAV
jgi:hypothetical protein